MPGTTADQLTRLGERIANLLRQAEDHETKAKEARQKAEECVARFNEMVARRMPGPQKAPRRERRQTSRQGAQEVNPGPLGVTGAIRSWAKERATPFRLADVQVVMRQVNPNVTDGPFYHLVRRGEIKKLQRGLFVHPLYYDAFAGGEVRKEEAADQATTH